jgi:hypothetical protein
MFTTVLATTSYTLENVKSVVVEDGTAPNSTYTVNPVFTGGTFTSIASFNVTFPTLETKVTNLAITGLPGNPVTGGTPLAVGETIDHSEMIVTVTGWDTSKLTASGKFNAAQTNNKITVSVTAKPGYTMLGVAAGDITIMTEPSGLTATGTHTGAGNTFSVDYTYTNTTVANVALAGTPIDLDDLIDTPRAGRIIADKTGFTGNYTVSATGIPAADGTVRYAAGTEYTATLVLTPDSGYTFALYGDAAGPSFSWTNRPTAALSPHYPLDIKRNSDDTVTIVATFVETARTIPSFNLAEYVALPAAGAAASAQIKTHTGIASIVAAWTGTTNAGDIATGTITITESALFPSQTLYGTQYTWSGTGYQGVPVLGAYNATQSSNVNAAGSIVITVQGVTQP